MIGYYVSKRVAVRMRGNLFWPELQALAQEMHTEGYAFITGRSYLRMCEYFGEWCMEHGISKDKVCEDEANAFIQRPTNFEGAPFVDATASGSAAVRYLLKILMRGRPERPASFLDLHVHAFCEWLGVVHGHMPKTIERHQCNIRAFLHYLGNGSAIEAPPAFSIEHVHRYIRERANVRGPGSAKEAQGSIQHYCRFRYVGGDDSVANIIGAHLRTPKHKRPFHHKVISSVQERQLLKTIGQGSPLARRDRATTLLMLYMGLRLSDVCALRLEDINWKDGSVLIRNTKVRRERLLPLPAAVGKAVATYLKHGRPKTSDRHVFVRHFLRHGTPKGTAVSRSVVRMQLSRYFEMAGLPRELAGTHVLRHTAATRMGGGGVPLKFIADVLGHKAISTTGIYVKASEPALNAVAMPWPAEVQA